MGAAVVGGGLFSGGLGLGGAGGVAEAGAGAGGGNCHGHGNTDGGCGCGNGSGAANGVMPGSGSAAVGGAGGGGGVSQEGAFGGMIYDTGWGGNPPKRGRVAGKHGGGHGHSHGGGGGRGRGRASRVFLKGAAGKLAHEKRVALTEATVDAALDCGETAVSGGTGIVCAEQLLPLACFLNDHAHVAGESIEDYRTRWVPYSLILLL